METTEINKLGKELELYKTVDYIGKGFPIILPRGAKILKIIKDYVEQEEEKEGYKIVQTPSVSNAEIYIIEDRFENEKDEMFIIKNNESDNDCDEKSTNQIVLRPYVQPFHCSIYKSKQYSYKELPVKFSETSTVFRNERDIKGITRTRQITMSDASIYSTPEKIEKTIREAIMMQQRFIKKLNLDVEYVIETWNDTKKEEYIGNIEEWDFLTESMKSALNSLNIEYKEKENAKMYGPTIKILYNKKYFSSLQIDFEITHRFNLKYISENNEEKFPVYMHLTFVGSYENMLGILLEKYKGTFPLWLSPTQIMIIDEGEEFDDYADNLKNEFIKNGLRAETDNSSNSSQNKIGKAVDFKIPYIVTIGKKELNQNTIKIHGVDKPYKIEEFIEEVLNCNKIQK